MDRDLVIDEVAKDMVVAQVEDGSLVSRRREQIVSAARKLFSEQGFHQTTIKEIAQAAGISAGLVYQYVREKEDILLLVILSGLSRYPPELHAAAEQEAHPIARLKAVFSTYCRLTARNKRAVVLAYRASKSLDGKHLHLIMGEELKVNDVFARYVRACINSGEFRNVNVEVVTYQLIMAAHTWVLKGWSLSARMKLENYIDTNFDILAGGLLNRKDRRLMRREGAKR